MSLLIKLWHCSLSPLHFSPPIPVSNPLLCLSCFILKQQQKMYLWGHQPTHPFPLQTGNMVIQNFGFLQGEDLLRWSRRFPIIFTQANSRARRALCSRHGHLQAGYKTLQLAKATLPLHFLCNQKSCQWPEDITFIPKTPNSKLSVLHFCAFDDRIK